MSKARKGRAGVLEAQMLVLRKELGEIRDAEERAESAPYVGRCFKYRNCYSMPKEPSDYWWLYMIVNADADGDLQGFQFQTDSNGDFRVEREKHLMLVSLTRGGYVEIPGAEFHAAWTAAMAALTSGYTRAILSPRTEPAAPSNVGRAGGHVRGPKSPRRQRATR